MKLPGIERAIIQEDKIRGYLLSPSHIEGRFKARFFRTCGFAEENWTVLANVIRLHAIENEAVLSKKNEYGTFYTVEGSVRTPTGENTVIRSVWLLETGSTAPRFITAYPLSP